MYALQDFFGAARDLRAWSYLAAKQIQFDYRRNLLGSAWIVIGFAITSGGIGWLIAQLQGRDIAVHIPYVAFGFVAWNFILTSVTEGSNTLTRNRGLLLQAPMERSVFVFSLVLKKLFLLLIHLATAMALAAALGWRPTPTLFMLVPGLLVLTLTAVGTVTFLSVIGTVLRDVAELVSAGMRLTFFFTPIIWTVEARFANNSSPHGLELVARLNPFTYFVELIRAPALGTIPGMETWIVTIGIGLLSLLLGLVMLQWLGRRLVFWL